MLSALLLGLGVTAYRLQVADRLQRVDDELVRRTFLLTRALYPPQEVGTPPPTLPNPRAEIPANDDPVMNMPGHVAKFFRSSERGDFYHAVWSPEQQLITRSANAPADLEVPQRPQPDEWQFARTRTGFREVFRYTSLDRCVLVGCPITAELAELRRFAWWLTGGGVAIVSVGLLGGWWVANLALKPLQHVISTAEKITDPSQRIVATISQNEVGRLVNVLNATFQRLEAASARQKQFTADAAHELRTPLTVIISETQTVLARERAGAEYRESLQMCLTTAQQMRHLTESLLQLARTESGRSVAAAMKSDLAKVALEAVVQVGMLAAKRQIKIHRNLAQAEVLGSPDQLRQVVANLVTNAIDHTPNFGNIHVTTGVKDGRSILEVKDSGSGIEPEDMPHLFERFYRVDKVRSRASGRTGLGLTICKAISDAYNGSITVKSEPGAGATFKVDFPAT